MTTMIEYNVVCDCGVKANVTVWPARCLCGAVYNEPHNPIAVPEGMDYPDCEDRIDWECTVASNIAMKPVKPSAFACIGCNRYPTNFNEITKQLALEANPNLASPEKGVGTRLANTLGWFVKKPRNCDCADREQIMNMWGPEGCRKNLNQILNWLRESAWENNYPFSIFGARALLKSIIRISELVDYD